MKEYKTHNPEMKIIEVSLEGTLTDEKTLHSLLKIRKKYQMQR